MARVRVKLIRPGVRQMLRSEPMEAAMLRRAKKVADEAKRTAPVVSGAYRDSIVAETYVGKNRARGLVTARIWYGAFVEARHRTLGRAINAARGG